MNVVVRPSFLKLLLQISDDDALKIMKALDDLRILKSLSESTHLKKLAGANNFFRYKVGSYRIILRWDKNEQTVTVEAFGNRKDIYKKR
jgi:mRNA-degrading endonuclease RelE of RelBE toxin-antitoxin system